MTGRIRRPTWAAPLAARLLAFAGLWWVLTGGVAYGWPVAAASVVAAAATSLALTPPGGHRWSARAAASSLPFFLGQSLLGGADVARRALSPRPRLAPGFVDHRLRLPAGSARTFFLCATNLLPGTLSFRVEGDIARVHVLDVGRPTSARLETLEGKVAAVFGHRLEEGRHS